MAIKPKTHKPYKNRAQRHVADKRESSTKRGYGSRWQKARAAFLAKYPLCRHCQEKDRITPANEVDHIIPHKGDWALFWKSDNWQPLCKPCHSRKTATEDGGFGHEQR